MTESESGGKLVNKLVRMSRIFTLPVAYFARVIDFRSYVDATMSL